MPDYNYGAYRKFVSKVLEVPEKDVLPLWDIDLAVIDRAIMAIGERHGRILLRRFGLVVGEERETLRAIAEMFDVSPDRVRQLEAQALSKLRRPGRIGTFRRLTKIGLERQKRVTDTPLLEKSVKDFELSTRALNALDAKGVRTLGELACKTEREMLKTKNFGRKSLFELKDLLILLGLDFAPD